MHLIPMAKRTGLRLDNSFALLKIPSIFVSCSGWSMGTYNLPSWKKWKHRVHRRGRHSNIHSFHKIYIIDFAFGPITIRCVRNNEVSFSYHNETWYTFYSLCGSCLSQISSSSLVARSSLLKELDIVYCRATFRYHTWAEVHACTDTLVDQPAYLVTRGWDW